MTAPTTSKEVEHRVRRSDALAWAVRAGLVGYGLLHLLVAWVAVRLLRTPDRNAVTGRGALAQLAGATSGRLTLLVLAVGFAAMVVWQLIAATVGYHDYGRGRRVLERLGALCRAAMWAYLAVTTAGLALSRGSGGRSPSTVAGQVMSWPFGGWVVALVGAVVGGIGIGLGVFGWRVGFLGQLDEQARMRGRRRVPIVVLGRVGYVTKGLALLLIGVLLIWAGWTRDPRKPGGLDRSLRELLGADLGPAAIIAIAIGIGCFGLFLIARAWHLNRDSLTS